MDNLLGYFDYVRRTLESFPHADDNPPTAEDMRSFMHGVGIHIKSLGARAPSETKAIIKAALLPVWDIQTNTPNVPHILPSELIAILEDLVRELEFTGKAPRCCSTRTTARTPGTVASPCAKRTPMATTARDAAQQLWTIEHDYRLDVGKDVTLNVQGHAKNNGDGASNALFLHDVEASFFDRATVKTFVALLDNYERETGKQEVITVQENVEMSDFLDACLETPHFRFLHRYLISKEKCGSSMHDLRGLLFDLWFAPYRRQTDNDTSGFEHVFVGEERRGRIIGFHNWIQFYIEEKKGLIDYLGWAGRRPDLDDDDQTPAVISVKLKWDDEDPNVEIKPISSFFIGTTPEFELAMLTAVFLTGEKGKNPVSLDGQNFNVTCYPKRTRYGVKVASAFAEF
eukprot:GEMP01045951.1.p1 GENE.GEMP01045951.1~~GEMP01045951.1.p1  ORF type:complete len:400 (+),score=110.73 GEMP01045951.1:171-1370(+)